MKKIIQLFELDKQLNIIQNIQYFNFSAHQEFKINKIVFIDVLNFYVFLRFRVAASFAIKNTIKVAIKIRAGATES